ncbi:ABC transporter permease [Ancylomarina euxinus]|uniref:ABC transporter permease n=1 Tax=Ancylomarina euxinus TaxID=2283627 RepID=A0A425Y7K5_9BACT|nr:ABC transporter permease [Ancylomarina euxinus]MCZ4693641.1 ABC transporter permease [Ancylomarina euxinus]MUP13869.1 FtsX-like permease family protein [Ancylomarina euxinus]RRG24501.1 ABC transporter permease [Ancylomarina euxinus]
MNWSINLKLSIRSILMNKVQSIISILGLGIGLGCVFLLSLLYIHENSFDNYIPKKENLYRVLQGSESLTSYPLGSTVQAEIPLVDNYFRYFQDSDVELKNAQNDLVKDKRFAYADTSLFACLGIRIIQGYASRSEREICISASTANRYFKKVNPINEILQVKINNQFLSLTVCGVYEDFPQNSRLYPNFICHLDLIIESIGRSQRHLEEYRRSSESFKDWDHFLFETYLLLNEKSEPENVLRHMQTYKNKTVNETRKEQDYDLQLVTDIYLQSSDLNERIETRKGNPTQLKYLLVISLFILLIAIVNYVFLTKAKMENRLKDFGVQKAMGASIKCILKQVLLESNMLSVISLLPATLVVILGFPFINETLECTLNVDVFMIWQSWLLLFLVVIVTGSISGIIIGLTITRRSSVDLIKGIKLNSSKRKGWTNSVLSIHFAIFIILVTGVLTIKKQLHYAQTSSKNIETENIIICELNSRELSKKHQSITNEIEKIPGVISTAGSLLIPPNMTNVSIGFMYENNEVQFDGLLTGKGMLDLLKIEFIDGQDFNEYRKNNIIFNESAAKKYNLKVGEVFNGFKVRGIVKDFNGHSFHSQVEPMVILQQHPQNMSLLAIKTTGLNNDEIRKKMAEFFKKISPDVIVNIYTLTDQVKQFYKKEQQQIQLISAFSLLAIVLSIMGLLGMVLNTISRKTKEIGIRKVNGAKTYQIITMLNKDFLKWVVFAFVVAFPIAWYVMDKWLANFAYKIELSWWIFALAGIIAMGIALLTVSIQSWRAATRNPVESLRYE